MKNNIGIIGNGFIGKILKRYYPDATIFDIQGETNTIESVLSREILFVAYNLPKNARTDEEFLSLKEYISKSTARIIIIKSTVVPGTTDRLVEETKKNIIYSPEFLTEMTAWEDFSKPQFQILGMPHQTLDFAPELFDLLPQAPVKRIISPKDAETLKHAFNSYYALKVSWFNQLYDSCQKLGVDYETVREIIVQDPWVGDSHSIIWHKGYRGFGGKCLSKDPHAFEAVSSMPLLKHIIEYNETLHEKTM